MERVQLGRETATIDDQNIKFHVPGETANGDRFPTVKQKEWPHFIADLVRLLDERDSPYLCYRFPAYSLLPLSRAQILTLVGAIAKRVHDRPARAT